MSITAKRRTAERLFVSGRALVHEGLYREALHDLERAEEAFRALDAPGHLFSPHPIHNGVSGLANTLYLCGFCREKLGDHDAAVTHYETAFINAKFEKRQAFASFRRTVSERLSACYERRCESMESGLRERFLAGDVPIDTAFPFPYSLDPDAIPLARLFELAPERSQQFRAFYEQSMLKDARIRLQLKTSDESTMKKMSVSIWTVLLAICGIYGLIVINAVLDMK